MARLCQLLYLSEKIKILISIKIVSSIKQGMSNMKRAQSCHTSFLEAEVAKAAPTYGLMIGWQR